MAINLETISGADLAAFKAALGVMGYMVPIGGTLKQETPVEYVDLALPDGYDWFRLVGVGFACSVVDAVAAAFSVDGGSTFINDAAHMDSYSTLSYGPNLNTPPGMSYGEGGDAVMSLSGFGAPVILIADIFAGSATRYPVLQTAISVIDGVQSHAIVPWYQCNIVNGASNAATPKARANLIRILPYGNGDVKPPTSGETMTFDNLTLYGSPTVA